MDKQEFYGQLAAILDLDTLKGEDVLKDFEQWDSLAILSVLAMADSNYGVTIGAAEIRNVGAAAELAELVESKQKK